MDQQSKFLKRIQEINSKAASYADTEMSAVASNAGNVVEISVRALAAIIRTAWIAGYRAKRR